MKRVLVLGTLIAVGGLSAAVSSEQELSQAAIDATAIEQVRDNLYVITGSSTADRAAFSGGNTGVYVGAEGVTLVDTKDGDGNYVATFAGASPGIAGLGITPLGKVVLITVLSCPAGARCSWNGSARSPTSR